MGIFSVIKKIFSLNKARNYGKLGISFTDKILYFGLFVFLAGTTGFFIGIFYDFAGYPMGMLPFINYAVDGQTWAYAFGMLVAIIPTHLIILAHKRSQNKRLVKYSHYGGH